jgi:hypothetical protein
MTYHELIAEYNFDPTKPDLRARVARAIVAGWEVIVACTGKPGPVITWSDNGYEVPFDAGNFAFRIDRADADSLGESVIAERIA